MLNKIHTKPPQNYKNIKKLIPYQILINPSQKNNPLWSHIHFKTKIRKNQIADFSIPHFRMSIIFLGLAFHYKYPNYIKEKLDDFVNSNEYKMSSNNILFLLINTKDPNDYMTDLQVHSVKMGITVLIGLSNDDIANYIRSIIYISKNEKHYLK